jgi:hypothetical protein
MPKRPLSEGMWQYWAGGPGERVDGNVYDWNWKESGSAPNSHWVAAAPAIRESIHPNGSTPVSGWEDSSVHWRGCLIRCHPWSSRKFLAAQSCAPISIAQTPFPAGFSMGTLV